MLVRSSLNKLQSVSGSKTLLFRKRDRCYFPNIFLLKLVHKLGRHAHRARGVPCWDGSLGVLHCWLHRNLGSVSQLCTYTPLRGHWKQAKEQLEQVFCVPKMATSSPRGATARDPRGGVVILNLNGRHDRREFMQRTCVQPLRDLI